jgi:diguanylate cyclase (GGDEF)-like protein
VHLRLILFAVSLAAASLVVSGIIVIRNYAQRNLELIASTVSYTVEPAVVFDDRQAIHDGLISVVAVAGIDRVQVRDPRGQILVEWRDHDAGVRSWLVDAVNSLLWSRPAVRQIRRDQAVIGEVRIWGNSEGILRYALSGAIIALSCIGLTVIATRILARRLQRDVIDPLDHVAEVAHAVRRERAFEKRVPPSGIAEIDRFGQDFNALLAELQGWHAGLTSENAELARRATLDPLTGLGNRAFFEQSLNEAIGESVRTSTSLAVLYCDIDGFKQINDHHGHVAGDAALVALAERLRGALRQSDRAFRVGGDEFAVLIAPLADGGHIDALVARIHAAIEPPLDLPNAGSTRSSLSIGFAIYPDDGVSPQDLLRRADAAMYRDKQRARDEGAGD